VFAARGQIVLILLNQFLPKTSFARRRTADKRVLIPRAASLQSSKAKTEETLRRMTDVNAIKLHKETPEDALETRVK